MYIRAYARKWVGRRKNYEMSPPLVICPTCGGGGDVRPTPYATTPCPDCGANGMVDSDGTGPYNIRDAETRVPCPACVACHGCDGVHMVTKTRAAWILAAIKGNGA